MPRQYLINSTCEFINICRAVDANKHLASLDAESLFTNVPVDSTIEIILRNVYEHPTHPKPTIPKIIMENLL